MTFQFAVGFYGWLLIIAATIWLNYFRIEIRHVRPTYLNSNWSRGVFGFMCLVLMTIDKGFDPWYLSSWLSVWTEIVYIVSAFILFFDPGLNIARGKPVDYQGKNSGWLDKLKKPAYYTLKFISFVGLVVSIIILL